MAESCHCLDMSDVYQKALQHMTPIIIRICVIRIHLMEYGIHLVEYVILWCRGLIR